MVLLKLIYSSLKQSDMSAQWSFTRHVNDTNNINNNNNQEKKQCNFNNKYRIKLTQSVVLCREHAIGSDN